MHNLHRNKKLDRKYMFNGTLPASCYLCGVSVVFALLDLVDKFQIRAVLNSMIYWIIPNTWSPKQIY